MQTQGFWEGKTFMCTLAPKHTDLCCLHVKDLFCCLDKWKALTTVLPGKFNHKLSYSSNWTTNLLLLLWNNLYQFILFQFLALFSALDKPNYWLNCWNAEKHSSGQAPGWKMFLRCQSYLSSKGWEKQLNGNSPKPHGMADAEQRTQPTHSGTGWGLPNPSHAAWDTAGPLHQPTKFLSAWVVGESFAFGISQGPP